jgi:SAM-dependent methyltransferase
MRTPSFDSAAASYDAARGFPPGVGEQVAEAAADWIDKRVPVLEVGIGTGRIAKPLLALGFNVTGVDLSRQMMARLRETLPTGLPSPALVQGDAAHLPLPKQSVGAVVSVHVFQLLPHGSNAVTEVRRVLRPGGVFLNGYEWRPPDSPGARIMERWRLILETAGRPALAAGARDFSHLTTELLQTGAAYEERAVGHWTATRSLARQLETIEHRTWSSGARISDNLLAGCLAQLRSWAIEEFGALDQERAVSHQFVWQRFTWL